MFLLLMTYTHKGNLCVSGRQFGVFLRNSLLVFYDFWHDGK